MDLNKYDNVLDEQDEDIKDYYEENDIEYCEEEIEQSNLSQIQFEQDEYEKNNDKILIATRIIGKILNTVVKIIKIPFKLFFRAFKKEVHKDFGDNIDKLRNAKNKATKIKNNIKEAYHEDSFK